MEENTKEEKDINLNNNEQISRFSFLLNGSSYNKENQKIKDISKSNFDNSKNSLNNTSVSHIVDDINLNLTNGHFEDIYNDISEILYKSTFTYTMKDDKIKISYGDNKNKDFKKLEKIFEKYKKIFELLDNLNKLIKYIKNLKDKIEKEIENRNSLEIKFELELHSIENFINNPIKNIICDYKVYINNTFKNKFFQDRDILKNEKLYNLNNFICDIKRILEREDFRKLKNESKELLNISNNGVEKEKEERDYSMYMNQSFNLPEINHYAYQMNKYFENQRTYNLSFNYTRNIGEINLYNYRANENLELENNHYLKKKVERKNVKTETKLSLLLSEIDKKGLNEEIDYQKIISDIKLILKKSTITFNINNNGNEKNIIEYKDNIFKEENINNLNFKNILKKMENKKFEYNEYFNLFDNYKKLIAFYEKIKQKIKERFKNIKIEIKLNFEEIDEEENNNTFKNISCEYILVKPVRIYGKSFCDKNILNLQKYHNLELFLNEISKNIETAEKLRIKEMEKKKKEKNINDSNKNNSQIPMYNINPNIFYSINNNGN